MNRLDGSWVILVSACLLAGCATNAGSTEDAQALGRASEPGWTDSGSLGLGGTPLFFSDVYGLKVRWRAGKRELSTETFELEPDPGDLAHPKIASGPHYQTRRFSTDFALTSVAARHAGELYLAGTDREGATVLERWVFPRQVGAYYSEKATRPPLLGVPVAEEKLTIGIEGARSLAAEALARAFGGGDPSLAFVRPDERPEPPAPVRKRLFRGTDVGPVESLAIDPEGRFALLVTRDRRELVQVLFTDPASAVVLHDASTLAILKHRVALSVRQHASEGRKYYLAGGESPAEPDIQMLEDADNDGVFESATRLYSSREYAASAYAPPSVWNGNYRDYKFELP